MRVCLVYDCLYPYTIGGAERWYRNLAERLAARGHEVTFLTRRQWGSDDQDPTCRACGSSPCPRAWSCTRAGDGACSRRCCSGWASCVISVRHGNRYDVVHTASFPYFSLLACGGCAPAAGLPARGRLARGLDAATIGASTWAPWEASSAGGSSARACAFRSARSASHDCTSGDCARRGSTVS